MEQRTHIDLDMDLVAQAARELGTEDAADTVHRALRDVVARGRRARLAAHGFHDLTPATRDALRERAGRAG